nr:two-component system regulatory protein YycI [Weissella diestrammenae]
MLIDLFLGYQLIQINAQARNNDDNAAVLNNMRSDNIKFDTLSTVSENGNYVGGDATDMQWAQTGSQKFVAMQTQIDADKHQLIVTPNEKLTLGKDLASARKMAGEMLKNKQTFLHGQRYRYSALATKTAGRQLVGNGHILVYQQVLPNRATTMGEVGQIKIYLNTHFELEKYTQTYISDTEVLREPMPTITAETAVIDLYQYNELPNNSVILWCKMGYSPLIEVDQNTVFVPTWFVLIQNGSKQNVLRINAFDGKLMN